MKSKIALASLSMDLKRVALGYHRGSKKMAERFLREALKRKDEVDQSELKPYLRNIINDISKLGFKKNEEEIAEYALMYSTLIQNASLA